MLDRRIEVLITLDKNLQYQQAVAAARIRVLILRPKGNTLHEVLKLAPQVIKTLEFIQPGQVVGVPE